MRTIGLTILTLIGILMFSYPPFAGMLMLGFCIHCLC